MAYRGASSVGRFAGGRRSLIREILGGSRKSDAQIIDAVTGGLPASALNAIVQAGLTITEVAQVVGVSERTLQRKLQRGTGCLDVAESDRTVRLARILADADRYVGDRASALRWLRTPNWALGDRRPLELLATEPGVELVRQSLTAIAYGGVA